MSESRWPQSREYYRTGMFVIERAGAHCWKMAGVNCDLSSYISFCCSYAAIIPNNVDEVSINRRLRVCVLCWFPIFARKLRELMTLQMAIWMREQWASCDSTLLLFNVITTLRQRNNFYTQTATSAKLPQLGATCMYIVHTCQHLRTKKRRIFPAILLRFMMLLVSHWT